MLLPVKDFRRFKLRAKDGDIGKAQEFFEKHVVGYCNLGDRVKARGKDSSFSSSVLRATVLFKKLGSRLMLGTMAGPPVCTTLKDLAHFEKKETWLEFSGRLFGSAAADMRALYNFIESHAGVFDENGGPRR